MGSSGVHRSRQFANLPGVYVKAGAGKAEHVLDMVVARGRGTSWPRDWRGLLEQVTLW